MNYEGLAEIATYEAWYYRKKYEETLDRLHQCKRRNREDKVKLRNTITTYREGHMELAKFVNAVLKDYPHGICERCLDDGDIVAMECKEIFAGRLEFPIFTQRYCTRGH